MKLSRVMFIQPVLAPGGTTLRSEFRAEEGIGSVHALELVTHCGAPMVMARLGESIAFYPLSACVRLQPSQPVGAEVVDRDEQAQVVEAPMNRAARRAAR